MEKVRIFLGGFCFCLLMVGCAGFSYKYYGIDGVDYSKGMLLGDVPENDLPFNVCEPNATVKHPCVVLKADEFFKLKEDYEQTKQRLKDCEGAKSM